MGRRGKKRSSSTDEEDKENRIRRKIRRLEEKLDRKKDARRKRSRSRNRRRDRRASTRSADRSQSRGRSQTRRSPYRRERSRSRFSSRQSSIRSASHDSQTKNQRTSRSRSRYSSDRHTSRSSSAHSPGQHESRNSPARSTSRRPSVQHTPRNSPMRSPQRRLSRARRSSEQSPSRPSSARAAPDNSIGREKSRSTSRARLVPEEKGRAGEEKTIDEEAEKIPEHEIELQEEILGVIGARLEADKKTAAAVHKDIALRWSEILKKGLPEEEVKTLIEKYPAPENCAFIVVPKLNAEITASVQENTTKRDKRIVEKQERIAACLAAIGRALSITLKVDSSAKLELIEKLSDAGRLLTSVHREESLARKGLILSTLNASLKSTLSNTAVDEWLFGADLEEKLKTAKNLERTSKELKQPTKLQQQQNNSNKKPKNARGPPRQAMSKLPYSQPYNRRPTSSGRRQPSSNRSDAKKTSYRRESTHHYGRRR